MYVVHHDCLDIITALLNAGAHTIVINKQGKTMFDLAEDKNHPSITVKSYEGA